MQGCWDDEEEARAIGEDIEKLQRKGHALSEIAILVRALFQMRAFEDRFITLGLPYRVIGGPRFYERQEISDATAYFEVTLNPSNDLKFERIVNVPRRGLGEVEPEVAASACPGAWRPVDAGGAADRRDRGAEAEGRGSRLRT